MKYLLSMVLIFIIAAAALTGCAAQHDRPGQESGSQSPEDISTAFEEQGGQTTQPPEDLIDDIPPYDAMLNLIVMDGKFRFQRIATTPCIVYSDSAITDMENGTAYNDRHDILTTVFRAMDGKTAIMSTSECDYSHYIYMFDNEDENIPWHYRFAICDCGEVFITNNDEFLCTIKLSQEEIKTILDSMR